MSKGTSKCTNKDKIIDVMRDRYGKLDVHNIINIIMEVEKRDKKDLSNNWINDRWYELKMKDRKELEDLVIKYKIPELDTLKPEEVMIINNLLDVYDKIRNTIFKDIKDSKIDTHKFSEHFIEILKKQNIKVNDISEDLIHKIDDELNSKLSNMLEYVVNIYQFYDDDKIREKYYVWCNVANRDELHCYKAKIVPAEDIEVLEKYGDIDKFIETEGKFFDKEEMELLFDIDLKKCIDWDEVTKRALDDVKKKFPEGTNIVLDKY